MALIIGNRYETTGPALKGGMGAVFKATDLQLGRIVALKRHHSSSNEAVLHQTIKEARLIAKVDHPSIVKIHDIIFEENDVWQVSEWVEGKTLAQLGRPLADEVCMYVFYTLLEALKALHLRGVIHRDIKPSNIMIDDKGQLKIIDFDIAYHADLSTGNTIAMSFQYADPRILAGKVAATSSDIYSLSLVILEMMSGKKVWPELSPVMLYQFIKKHWLSRCAELTDSHYPPLIEALSTAFMMADESAEASVATIDTLLQKLKPELSELATPEQFQAVLAAEVACLSDRPLVNHELLINRAKKALASKATKAPARNLWLSFLGEVPHRSRSVPRQISYFLAIGVTLAVVLTGSTNRNVLPFFDEQSIPIEIKTTPISIKSANANFVADVTVQPLDKEVEGGEVFSERGAPKPKPKPKATRTALLRISANAWADVYEDGKKLGRIPSAIPFKFKSSRVNLQFKSPLIESISIDFELKPGREVQRNLQFTRKLHRFKVNLSDGEALYIDGERTLQKKDGQFGAIYGPHVFAIKQGADTVAEQQLILTPSSKSTLEIERL